jgi:hypothetical protein
VRRHGLAGLRGRPPWPLPSGGVSHRPADLAGRQAPLQLPARPPLAAHACVAGLRAAGEALPETCGCRRARLPGKGWPTRPQHNGTAMQPPGTRRGSCHARRHSLFWGDASTRTSTETLTAELINRARAAAGGRHACAQHARGAPCSPRLAGCRAAAGSPQHYSLSRGRTGVHPAGCGHEPPRQGPMQPRIVAVHSICSCAFLCCIHCIQFPRASLYTPTPPQ